jgi:hypothetical protein
MKAAKDFREDKSIRQAADLFEVPLICLCPRKITENNATKSKGDQNLSTSGEESGSKNWSPSSNQQSPSVFSLNLPKQFS